MDSLPFLSSSDVFFCPLRVFRALRSPYTTPIRSLGMSSRWDPRYLSCTFTMFPLTFPLVSFMSHGRFTRLLGYFDHCLVSFVHCTTTSRTTNKGHLNEKIGYIKRKPWVTKVESVIFLVFPSCNIRLINVSCVFIIWRCVFFTKVPLCTRYSKSKKQKTYLLGAPLYQLYPVFCKEKILYMFWICCITTPKSDL